MRYPLRQLLPLLRRLRLVLCQTLLLCLLPLPATAGDTLRVGLIDKPPLVFANGTAAPQGLFIDLLDHIAARRNWRLEYVTGSPAQLQTLTKRGEIDLIAPLGYTEEREGAFDFPQEFVLLEWGVLICAKGAGVTTLFDLQGKRIAVVKGDVFVPELKHHLEEYFVAAQLLELESYRAVAEAVATGECDAGLLGNATADYCQQSFAVTPTPIIFEPVIVSFAGEKGRHPDVLQAIDEELRALKEDPQSIYHRASEKWLAPKRPIPWRLLWLGALMLTAIAALAWLAWNLRQQVRRKISELVDVNNQLQTNREELHQINQQFQALLDGIPDRLMLISPQLQVVWANRAAQQQLPQTPTECAPLPCFRYRAGRENPCPDCPAQRCFDSGQPQETTLRDGERVFGVKVFPICDAAGRVEHLIELSVDITEKLRLREATDRENRLAAVGTLAAGVAHEINNPAGLILSNLELVCEAFEDAAPILDTQLATNGDFPFGGLPFSRMREQLPALLKETGDAARRIRQTVEDLKDFARGGGQHEVVEFPLREAIERSIRLTDHLLHKATGRMNLHLTEEPIMLLGNKRRIEQVLVNLLANACQALPNRNGAIHLTTRFDAARQVATISVRDEGVGIPAEHLPKLATPFFTTRQKEGGTGLGLSVSFGIVREHGGTIHFVSEPGHGTTVTVALPASITEFTP